VNRSPVQQASFDLLNMLLSALLDNQQQNTDQSETIMPRGIPWDDLPKRYGNKDKEDKPIVKEVDITPREVNFAKDSMDIGRRVAFGVVVRYSIFFV
jgi:hypothetical protein